MTALRPAAAVLAVLLLLWIVPAGAEPPDPYLDFAHHLYDEGDYYRAVTEAKRFLFINPDHERADEARMLIARSHYESREFSQARDAYADILSGTDDLELAAKAVIEMGACLEFIDPMGQAAPYYRNLAEADRLPEPYGFDVRNEAWYRLGWLYLEDGQWNQAEAAFDAVDAHHHLKPSARELAYRAQDGENVSHRSPTAAGIMSAVLPGAGQLYDGRPTDAAIAFGLNAAFIWGSVEAYQDENWAVFALLGLMEVGWYGGNIYNAVNGAHISNREAKEDFLERLRRDHAWQLGYMPKFEALLLSWSFEY